MRIAILVVLLQAAGTHDAGNIVIILFRRNDLMLTHCFADDLTDRDTRRKARIRILEDDLDPRAEFAQLFLRQG